jgi:glycosyltransferase involved in cell wall biosynthesis
VRAAHLLTATAFAGIERHAFRLTLELRRSDVDASIICRPAAEELRAAASAAGVPVHLLRPSVRPVIARADVLHVHDGRAAAAGTALRVRTSARLVRTQHFTRPASGERTGFVRTTSLAAHRILNGRLDGYIGVSKSVLDEAAKRREVGSVPRAVIPPGIDLPTDAAVADAQIWRRTQNAFRTIAYVGRLEPEKQLDLLLDAIPHVLAREPRTLFVIAGDGSRAKPLREQARRLGVSDAIQWLGWVRASGEVLTRAHLYVNPLPWEGFGMATAEAMAYGLPVVAVASGASQELVDHGVTGCLVPLASGEKLAGGILEIVRSSARLEGMGAAAREKATKLYGAQVTAARTREFYDEVLRARPPAAA